MDISKRLFACLKALELREGRQITWGELARRAGGIPAPSMSRYKEGAGEPALDQLVGLARALGVDPGWLAFGEESQAPSPGQGLGDIIQRHVEQAHAAGKLRDVTEEHVREDAPVPPKPAPTKHEPPRRRQSGGR